MCLQKGKENQLHIHVSIHHYIILKYFSLLKFTELVHTYPSPQVRKKNAKLSSLNLGSQCLIYLITMHYKIPSPSKYYCVTIMPSAWKQDYFHCKICNTCHGRNILPCSTRQANLHTSARSTVWS